MRACDASKARLVILNSPYPGPCRKTVRPSSLSGVRQVEELGGTCVPFARMCCPHIYTCSMLELRTVMTYQL